MDLIVQCSSGLLSITGIRRGRAGPLRLFGGRRECRHVRHHRHPDGPAVPRADGPRPVCRRFDVRRHDLRDEFLLHDLPGIERAVRRPMGSSYPTIVPYRVFPSQDRDFSLAVGSEKLWSAFCKAIDRLDLGAPSRLRDQRAARASIGPPLRAILIETVPPAARAMDWLNRSRRPASLLAGAEPARSRGGSAERFRGMFPVIDHPTIGPHRVTGTPIKFSDTTGGRSASRTAIGPTHADLAGRAACISTDRLSTDLSRRGVIFDAASAKRSG